MPIEQVWGLVLVLAGIAILAIFDDVRTRLTLNVTNEQLSTLREKVDIAGGEHEKAISNLKKVHSDEVCKLKMKIEELETLPWQAMHNEPHNIDDF